MIRRRLARCVLLIGLAGLCGLSGHRAAGFSWFVVDESVVVWPTAESLRYLSPSTFPPGSVSEEHYLAAMGLWNIVPSSDFVYTASTLDQDYPYDHEDGFNDTLAVPAASLDPGVLAVTVLVNQGAVWFDMDMLIADQPGGVGWMFEPNPTCEQVTTPTPANGYSFLLVAAHELGHALGLGHDPIGDESPGASWFIGTMNPRYPSGGPIGQGNIVELHADDRNGVRALYPSSGPVLEPVVDVALAGYAAGPVIGRAIPLPFSPATVDAGGQVVAASVIENFGNTNVFGIRQGFYLSSDSFITPADMLLGDLQWDVALGDALSFDVTIDLPPDLPAGTYYLGSIIDDLDALAETYEDNNAAVYCEPLVVTQQPPSFTPFVQQSSTCGEPFVGPSPVVELPLNMGLITWSLDNPEPGMSIHPVTGVVTWPQPVRSPFLYTLIVRATNGADTTTRTMFLGVDAAAPQIAPIGSEVLSCLDSYVGPTPVVISSACMEPIINWSLDVGPPGMTIDSDTGQVSWPQPVPRRTPYTVAIRATNAVGNGSETWTLLVRGTSDVDGDGEVDLGDYTQFRLCLHGADVPITIDCACGDLDSDGDIDLYDATLFQRTFEGPSLQQGACCMPDGTCGDGSFLDCVAAGGGYQGDSTTCAESVCAGACCFAAGCLDLSADQCGVAAGTFGGFGTTCAVEGCSSPATGACCHDDDTCSDETVDNCAAFGNSYAGDGTTCASTDCSPDPVGACCFGDGTCSELPQSTCGVLQGAFAGEGVACADAGCLAVAVGACCDLITWSCSEVSASACGAAGGVYGGDDTSCAFDACPEYRNDIATASDYWAPGAAIEMADDITLSGTARRVAYYELAVYGGGTGVFDVSAALYDGCPGDGGMIIAGSDASWQAVSDDGDIYLLSADLMEAPVTVPDTVWMVVEFSTPSAGWVMAGPAESGSTDDIFGQNDPPWGCAFGFEGGLYSGFFASVDCVE